MLERPIDLAWEDGEILQFHDSEIARAICWAVEYTAKKLSEKKYWPVSWAAGFPGLKAQALLDFAAYGSGSAGEVSQ